MDTPPQNPVAQASVPQPAPPTPAAPQGAKPATVASVKNTGATNKRFVLGCVSAFGCSLLLFVMALFGFLAFGGGAENPIFGFFGVPPNQVIDVLITITSLIFLFVIFITFIFAVVGGFKITTTRKDDKEGRKKAMLLTLLSLASMAVLVVLWITGYFFLDSKRSAVVKISPIVTAPEQTINLTAPTQVEFDGSNAPIDTKLYEVLSYSWDFADKTPQLSGKKQKHTFTDIGEYKVTLTVNTKLRASAEEKPFLYTKDVTVQNVKAKVVIKASAAKGTIPLKVSLDGSESSSQNGEITGYSWDLDNDTEFDDGSKDTAEVTFDKVGAYTVSLRVQDSTGDYATNSIEIEAQVPDTPVAVINVEGVSDTTLELNKSYVFSGAESISPTGSLEKYSWDFGDSSNASTRTANHTYKEAGEYEVTLTVTDSARKTGKKTQRFTVKTPDEAPVAFIKTTPEAQDNQVKGQAPFTVAFDGSQSRDPNNNIVEYSWDFNADKKTDDTNPIATHTFNVAGTYTVTLSVTDTTELSGKTQIVVSVDAAGLKADVKTDAVAGTVPLTVKFDASGSSYPDGSIVNYEWDFGDGSLPRPDTAQVSYQYTKVGTFTAKVTAITSDNKRAAAQVIINVRPVSVKACFETSVGGGEAPLEVEFDPTCSTGTVTQYRWNFANLARATERKPKYTFRDPGEYTVDLEVADTQNVVDRFSKTITIQSK